MTPLSAQRPGGSAAATSIFAANCCDQGRPAITPAEDSRPSSSAVADRCLSALPLLLSRDAIAGGGDADSSELGGSPRQLTARLRNGRGTRRSGGHELQLIERRKAMTIGARLASSSTSWSGSRSCP